MKKVKYLLIASALMLMMSVSSAHAQNWASLVEQGDATYVGGFYAAVSYGCLGTDYTNDSGMWASGIANIPYEKGCAEAVYDAIIGQIDHIQPVR